MKLLYIIMFSRYICVQKAYLYIVHTYVRRYMNTLSMYLYYVQSTVDEKFQLFFLHLTYCNCYVCNLQEIEYEKRDIKELEEQWKNFQKLREMEGQITDLRKELQWACVCQIEKVCLYVRIIYTQIHLHLYMFGAYYVQGEYTYVCHGCAPQI